MLIESVQGLTGAGGADVTDVAANALGAALGVGAAAMATAELVRAGLATGTPVEPAPPGVRRRRPRCRCRDRIHHTDHRRRSPTSRIHDELENVFADTTYDEIAAAVGAESVDPEQLDDVARFVDSEQIFGAISVRPDGFRYTDDQIEMRWPALFFGFRRVRVRELDTVGRRVSQRVRPGVHRVHQLIWRLGRKLRTIGQRSEGINATPRANRRSVVHEVDSVGRPRCRSLRAGRTQP